jgi:hypothetical protein
MNIAKRTTSEHHTIWRVVFWDDLVGTPYRKCVISSCDAYGYKLGYENIRQDVLLIGKWKTIRPVVK